MHTHERPIFETKSFSFVGIINSPNLRHVRVDTCARFIVRLYMIVVGVVRGHFFAGS